MHGVACVSRHVHLERKKEIKMIRQIAVFIENQKGSLRKAASALHERQIGIYAFSTIDTPEFGILRLVVDDPALGVRTLEEQGFVAKLCEVIAVELADQSAMDELLTVIHEGNININYTYSSFGRVGQHPVMIVHTSDLDETEEMLRGRGFSCL